MTTVYPFNLHVGPLNITGYGIMMMVGFLMGGWLIDRQLRERGWRHEYAADITVAAVIGGIAGAKLWYVAATGEWGSLFTRGGLVWYGGFLGGALVPPMVRLALAAGLGGAAALLTGASAPGEAVGFTIAAAREIGLGLILAFLAAAPVEAARSAGRLVDTLRGATLAELHVAPLRQRESATGDLQNQQAQCRTKQPRQQ